MKNKTKAAGQARTCSGASRISPRKKSGMTLDKHVRECFFKRLLRRPGKSAVLTHSWSEHLETESLQAPASPWQFFHALDAFDKYYTLVLETTILRMKHEPCSFNPSWCCDSSTASPWNWCACKCWKYHPVATPNTNYEVTLVAQIAWKAKILCGLPLVARLPWMQMLCQLMPRSSDLTCCAALEMQCLALSVAGFCDPVTAPAGKSCCSLQEVLEGMGRLWFGSNKPWKKR